MFRPPLAPLRCPRNILNIKGSNPSLRTGEVNSVMGLLDADDTEYSKKILMNMILRCLFISHSSTSLSLESSYMYIYYIYITSMIVVCIVPVSHHYFSCSNGHYFYDMKMLNIFSDSFNCWGCIPCHWVMDKHLEKNTPVHSWLMDHKKYKHCIVDTSFSGQLFAWQVSESKSLPCSVFVASHVTLWGRFTIHNHLVIIRLMVQKSQTTTWDMPVNNGMSTTNLNWW